MSAPLGRFSWVARCLEPFAGLPIWELVPAGLRDFGSFGIIGLVPCACGGIGRHATLRW